MTMELRSRRPGAAFLFARVILFLSFVASVLGSHSSTTTVSSCCSAPYSLVDCSTESVEVDDSTYTCRLIDATIGCFNCLRNLTEIMASGIECMSCCASASSGCGSTTNRTVTWAAYTSTVLFLSVCCCCSVLCAFTEKRRRKKGVSFAQAYSLPQGMPMVQATVRSFRRRRNNGSNGGDSDDADGGGRRRRGTSALEGGSGDDSDYSIVEDPTIKDSDRVPVAARIDEGELAFHFACPVHEAAEFVPVRPQRQMRPGGGSGGLVGGGDGSGSSHRALLVAAAAAAAAGPRQMRQESVEIVVALPESLSRGSSASSVGALAAERGDGAGMESRSTSAAAAAGGGRRRDADDEGLYAPLVANDALTMARAGPGRP